MIEIWEECTRFQTSQRLADQARMMIKKGLLSGLEILEIHPQINRETCQQDLNTVTKMLNAEKQELSYWIETSSSTNLNTTHPNTTEQTLT